MHTTPRLRTAPILWITLLVLLCAAGLTKAQGTSDAPFTDEMAVTEVLLDVLVTDRDGQVIIGLNEDDFIVEEAGEAVDVTGVAFYSNRRRLDQAAVPAEVPADRFFVLFFHDLSRQGGSLQQTSLLRQQLEAGRQSRRWVREEMLGGDWVAVVSYDVKLKVHQDFTQNREDLDRAIQQAIQGKDPANVWPSRRPVTADQPGERPSLLPYLPQGNDLRDETTRIYDGLRVLAEATGGISGRKNLLMFTIGFGDLDAFTGNAEPDRRFYPTMLQALNDHNVAVYPIDLTPSNTETQRSNVLSLLALETGGRYWENVVNFLTPLQRIADENNGYYLLSYRAEHPAGTQGYQQVRVQTRNPELRVRARQGYRFGT